MAKTFYVPIESSGSHISKEVKKMYVPVKVGNQVLSKKVVKAYVSVNGYSKQFFGDGGDGYNYKKAYHDPDPYVSSLIVLPLTVTENTAYTAAYYIADASGVTPYLFTIDSRITSNQSKVYMALTYTPTHPTYGKGYNICYISENPFTFEEYQTNEQTGQSTTFRTTSVARTMNNITYHARGRFIGWEHGTGNYQHQYASSSFDVSKCSQSYCRYSSDTEMWDTSYIAFTGTIQNY
jgi:hypothetical protein